GSARCGRTSTRRSWPCSATSPTGRSFRTSEMTKRLALLLLLLLGSARGEGKLELTVNEPAGIRRFGYPVHATLKLPREVSEKDRFRLLAGGKPVAAQFRLVAGQKKSVALDFNVSLGPDEG